MKRLFPAIFPIFLLLGACSPSAPTASPSAGEILTSVARTLTALPSQTPAVVYVTPAGESPTPLPPTDTPVPTNTPAPPPAPQTIYIIYPTPYPTPYPPPIVYPTPVPMWSPAYADQFIYYYFQRINSRDYTTTWSLLTEAFKVAVNPDGYYGYAAFWNTVSSVVIHSVAITSLSTYTATVLVDMVYYYAGGAVVSSVQPYHLYFDAYRSTWMFDSVSVPVPTPIPTLSPPYLTPEQFIYYYFNNINLRNYPLTWSLLTPSFIANNNPPSSGGYTGYVDFWNSVARVDVVGTAQLSNSGLYADVAVWLVFNYVSSIVTTANPTYHLFYNSGIANWQFYSP